jgi:hypothetical protein
MPPFVSGCNDTISSNENDLSMDRTVALRRANRRNHTRVLGVHPIESNGTLARIDDRRNAHLDDHHIIVKRRRSCIRIEVRHNSFTKTKKALTTAIIPTVAISHDALTVKPRNQFRLFRFRQE